MYNFKSEKAKKIFSKACAYHRGVMPHWQCGNPAACLRRFDEAYSIELVELGWQ